MVNEHRFGKYSVCCGGEKYVLLWINEQRTLPVTHCLFSTYTHHILCNRLFQCASLHIFISFQCCFFVNYSLNTGCTEQNKAFTLYFTLFSFFFALLRKVERISNKKSSSDKFFYECDKNNFCDEKKTHGEKK